MVVRGARRRGVVTGFDADQGGDELGPQRPLTALPGDGQGDVVRLAVAESRAPLQDGGEEARGGGAVGAEGGGDAVRAGGGGVGKAGGRDGSLRAG